MAEESVKVAVRVRPFNKRERQRNAKLIIDMKGPNSYIQDPENPNEEPRSFAFDYSYWSHDGCKDDGNGYYGKDTSHPNGKKFADQRTVYDDLGKGVLKNAWEGFNSTLFAYGQTGSGKSWSMVGYGVNKGIVPLFCDEIFQGIDKKKADGEALEFEVEFSMLEIYNEQVRDLLNPKSSKRGGLKVRQHPKKGFYADGLTFAPVNSYKQIEEQMEEGTTNRTVAATNMNATSSRAHTIVGIKFVQKYKNAAGEDTSKTAICNLVDLAGSERADSTGATGDRLKEGAAINQSLSSLGNVISALADKANGKNVRVPFRDSVLTKLLKNALGGNSKTVMIAAVSPADINYDESLSTLRYADRAKQIKTSVKVNEDPTEKLIRELNEENERLKQMLASGGIDMSKASDVGDEDTTGMSDEEIAALKKEMEEDFKAQMSENANEMEEMKKSYEEKLKAFQEGHVPVVSETNEKKKTTPHIYNLNFDPQLSGRIVYFTELPENKIGSKKGDPSDIVLAGPSIQEQHAVIFNEGGKFAIERGNSSGRLLRNGEPVSSKTELCNNDRLMFGTTQLMVFVNPKEAGSSDTEVSYEMAQEEIASNSGFDMNTENKSRDDMLLQEDLMEVLPAIEEANSISEELDKKLKFDAIVVSPEARGDIKGRSEVMIKVTNIETEIEWVWPRTKFFNRKYVMQEMYENYAEGEDWQLPAEKDPFEEDPNAETHIGSVKAWLKSLSYQIEMDEQLEITDFKGTEVGLLNFEIRPCDKKGKEYTEADDIFVDDPKALVGRDVYFNVKITKALGLPKKFTDVYAKFLMYVDDEPTCTKKIADTTNPEFNFKKQFSFAPATKQLVSYLEDSAIMIQIWGKQKPSKVKKNLNTKQTLHKLSEAKGQSSAANTNVKTVDPAKAKFMMEVAMLKKKQEKLEHKMAHMRKMVQIAEDHNKQRISLKLIKEIMNSQMIKMRGDDDDGGRGGSGKSDKSKACVLL
ncbi:unnamed protein product [Owenia fusiformis]|uniref:Kinesin-like protein 6 n=1 Tax=Owenia fusiformis TaxID=6347 RepID=A0A8S4MWZ9_OWEFU|nr:unnamed protein product [Owenia fusiformis]